MKIVTKEERPKPIGNRAALWCDECHSSQDVVIEIDTQESTWLCRECLQGAIDMLDGLKSVPLKTVQKSKTDASD